MLFLQLTVSVKFLSELEAAPASAVEKKLDAGKAKELPVAKLDMDEKTFRYFIITESLVNDNSTLG